MKSPAVTRADIDEVLDLLGIFMQQVGNEFTVIKKDLVYLSDSQYRLVGTVDGLASSIDRYETERTARDSQFQKLVAWARKDSEKTGVPLEKL